MRSHGIFRFPMSGLPAFVHPFFLAGFQARGRRSVGRCAVKAVARALDAIGRARSLARVPLDLQAVCHQPCRAQPLRQVRRVHRDRAGIEQLSGMWTIREPTPAARAGLASCGRTPDATRHGSGPDRAALPFDGFVVPHVHRLHEQPGDVAAILAEERPAAERHRVVLQRLPLDLLDEHAWVLDAAAQPHRMAALGVPDDGHGGQQAAPQILCLARLGSELRDLDDHE